MSDPSRRVKHAAQLRAHCQAAHAAGMTAVVYRDAEQATAEIHAALRGETA